MIEDARTQVQRRADEPLLADRYAHPPRRPEGTAGRVRYRDCRRTGATIGGAARSRFRGEEPPPDGAFAAVFPDPEIVATLWRQLSWSHFRNRRPSRSSAWAKAASTSPSTSPSYLPARFSVNASTEPGLRPVLDSSGARCAAMAGSSGQEARCSRTWRVRLKDRVRAILCTRTGHLTDRE